MKCRTVATIALTGVLLTGTGVFGQEGPEPGSEGFMKPAGHHGGSRGGRRGRGGLPPDRMLRNRIGLSEEQLAHVNQLREDFKAIVEPLFEEGHAIRESLRTELESEAPFAETVGNLVIAGRDVRKQIRANHQNLRESFESILTPEQAEKMDEFKERRGRHGFGRGHGRRGPPRGPGIF